MSVLPVAQPGVDVGSTARRTEWFRKAGYGVMVHYLADAEVSVTRADSLHSDFVKRQTKASLRSEVL